MINEAILSNIIFLCVVFAFGWLVGKILRRLPVFMVVILAFVYSIKYVSIRTTPLLLINFSFICGFSTGYSLFPILRNIFDDILYRVSSFFYWVKRPFLAISSLKFSKRKQSIGNNKKSSYERKIREREEELNRQAEELRRKQREAEEELRRAREEREKAENKGKNRNYPSNLSESFEVLGVSPGLSIEEYKKAWKKRVMEYHPDKVNTLGELLQEQAEEQMKRINRAWEIIKSKI